MDNVHVLSLYGEIDRSRKAWIEHELRQIAAYGTEALTLLDLTDLRYLDSTFLNALISMLKPSSSNGSSSPVCIVAPAGETAARFLAITKLDAMVPRFDDMPSALRFAASATADATELRARMPA